MYEYAGNVLEKIGGHIKSTDNVLEIGVALGITCTKVASKVSKYYGVDISKKLSRRQKRLWPKRGLLMSNSSNMMLLKR